MNHALANLVGALAFLWLGMVLAISVEAPLKFRAPGVTIPIGLGIGRLVFRALNIMESVVAVAVVVAVAAAHPTTGVLVSTVVVVGLLVTQLAAVRPPLTRHSNRVLSGTPGPRSTAHYVYIALELLKIVGLAVLGILALSA